MKNILLLTLLTLGSLGCSNESLNIQTDFPFTVTAESLPAKVKVDMPVELQLTIRPERVTSATAFTLKYRTLSEEVGLLSVDGRAVKGGQTLPTKSLTPTLLFKAINPGIYAFSVAITDQNGVSREIPISLEFIK